MTNFLPKEEIELTIEKSAAKIEAKMIGLNIVGFRFLINSITCFDFVIKLLKLYALKCETDIVVENKIWIRFFAQKQFHFNECLTE
jgi:hypothetical protein